MFGWTFNNELEKYKNMMKVVTEAPGDDTATDYEAAARQLDNAPTAAQAAQADAQNPDMNDDATDYTEDANAGDDADTNEQDDVTADENAEENPDDDMEATDYDEGAEGEDTGDEEADPDADAEDTPGEETPEDDGDKSKNTYLIRDFIELFYTTKNMIEKLNNVIKLRRNKIG